MPAVLCLPFFVWFMDMDPMSAPKRKFDEFLKRLPTKGFLNAMQFIKENEGCHYNDIANFLMGKRIVSSRASVTTIINSLLDLELVERSVLNTKPMRTTYRLTKRAVDNLKRLKGIERSFR